MVTTREHLVPVDDGIELHVRDHLPSGARDDAHPDDTAASFLLVHGLSSNALLWDGVAATLAAAGHRSVAVDLRAHGRSDASDDLTHGRIVADLATVIDRTGLGRPYAVGQSWGGNLVVELAAARPGTVAGIVGVDGGLITLSDRFLDVATCWEVLAPPRLDHLRWADLEAGVAARTRGWPDGAARAQLGNLTSDEHGRVRAILTRERHRSIVEQLYAHRPLDQLATLEVPMLLLAVTGDERGVTDERTVAAAVAAAGERFTAVLLPGRDHDVHLQEPATVATLLLDWVAGRPVPEVA